MPRICGNLDSWTIQAKLYTKKEIVTLLYSDHIIITDICYTFIGIRLYQKFILQEKQKIIYEEAEEPVMVSLSGE